MDKYYGPPDAEARIALLKEIANPAPPCAYLLPLSGCTCLWSNTAAGASSIVSRDPKCPMHGDKK